MGGGQDTAQQMAHRQDQITWMRLRNLSIFKAMETLRILWKCSEAEETHKIIQMGKGSIMKRTGINMDKKKPMEMRIVKVIGEGLRKINIKEGQHHQINNLHTVMLKEDRAIIK